MNRQEFIDGCRNLSAEQLKQIITELRGATGGRIPPQVTQMLRSLDHDTEVREMNVDTAWGRSKIYAISETKPADGKRPIIVNVHGGGWCLEHSDRDVYFCRRLAVRTGALIIDCDYVLAPEYPYPAAIEELEAVITALPEIAEPLGGDSRNVILCGQSAGGNLLGAVSQRMKLGSDPNIRCQILAYLPADNYNDHFNGEELDERGKCTEYYGFFYNQSFEERKNSDVSLVMASEEELRGVPKTHIIAAGLDNLMPEGKLYYERLRDCGVDCTYRCFENSRHGFLVNLYDEWREGEEYVVGCVSM